MKINFYAWATNKKSISSRWHGMWLNSKFMRNKNNKKIMVQCGWKKVNAILSALIKTQEPAGLFFSKLNKSNMDISNGCHLTESAHVAKSLNI